MSILHSILVSLFLSSFVLATPHVPTQWTTKMTGYKIGGEQPCSTLSAVWAFDELNQYSRTIGNWTEASTGLEIVQESSLSLCSNSTSMQWNSNNECQISCCYGSDFKFNEEPSHPFIDILPQSRYGGECACELLDIFIYVKASRNVGPCVSGTIIGTLWEFAVPGGKARINYCFNGDTPLSYELLDFVDCISAKFEFSDFTSGPPSTNYFEIPSFCNCSPPS